VLGWNHKLPALLGEFQSQAGESFVVHVLSSFPVEQRARALRHVEVGHIELSHSEADMTIEADLAAVRPHEFDSIVLLASDRMDTHEESDARTLLSFLVLERLLPPRGSRRAAVIVELLEPDNAELLGRGRGEVIVSPLIVSHMLAQVALRRELRVVFEDLFAAGGAELLFQPIGRYAEGAGEAAFGDLATRAAAFGEVALGVRTGLGAEELHLNPERASRWAVREGVEVATLVGGG
jgi:ion channel POLLUX/CASTOR